MSRTFRITLAASLVIACAATFVRADDKDDIKAAGKAFSEAIHANDVAAAKKHVVTCDNSDKFVDVLGGISQAKKKLVNAAVAKFGDDGKSIDQSKASPVGFATSHDFEGADVDVTGDTAVLTPKTGATRPVNFKKDGGEWKIDFTEFLSNPQIEHALPIMGKMATAMNETAAEINDGKYESVDAAKLGLRQKIMATLMPNGAPGGRPSAPPSN